MDRDRIVGTGFRVDPAELAVVADHLHDTAEDAVARARHEYAAAAADPAVIHRRRRAGGSGESLAAAPRLPDWLPDFDAAWQQQRAELVVATRAAAAALVGAGSTYREIDERLGAGLDELHPRGDGRAALGATVLNQAAIDPAAAAAAMDAMAMDATPAEAYGSSSSDERGSLEFAIAVWSQRSRSTNRTVHAVTDLATAPPGWTGQAADAYTEWLHTHRDQWEGLHEDATRIRDALAAHDTPHTGATGPTTAPAGLSPADLFHYSVGRAGPVPGDTTPPTTTPDAAATSDGRSDGREQLATAPALPLPTPATLPAPAAALSTPDGPSPTPDTAVSTASVDPTPPDRLPDTTASNRIRLADNESYPARADDLHDSPHDPQGQPDMLTTNPGLAAALLGGGLAGGAATMAAIGAARPARVLQVVPPIGHDTPDGPLAPHPDATNGGPPAPTHRPGVPAIESPATRSGSADAPAIPWTGTAPPPSTTTPSTPPPAPGGGTIAPPSLSRSSGTGGAVSSGRIGPGADSIGAALDALTTFPGRDTSRHVDASAAHPSHRHPEDRAALDAATGRDWGLPLDIGVVGRDPVWLDLAATAGVGLTGPGAAAVTRTVLQLLLTYHRPVRVTAHFNTLAALLDEDTAPDLPPQDPTGDAASSPPVVGHPWLSLAARSFDILDAAHIEIDRRRGQPAHQPQSTSAIGEHAAPVTTVSEPPWVMLVPAPTSTRARQRLAEVLDAGRRYGITAVLLGPSDTGTTLHIDHDHRVIHHHTADTGDTGDTGAGGSLNEAQLRTTRSVELGKLIAAAGEPDPGFVSPETSTPPRTDTPTEPSSPPPPPPAPRDLAPASMTRTEPIAATAAPLTVATLTVFGQTCLRYRSPSAIGPAAVPDSRADTTSPNTVPGIEESSEDTDGRIVDGLGPRATELLLFLAVHPGGASRDYLVATLWPDAAGDRPSGPFYNLLARLRRTLQTTTEGHDLDALIVRAGDKYRLNLDLVATDYTTFLHAATDINHPDPTIRARACETVIHTYRGALGRDHTSSEWLLELQLNARYRYLCALTSLAQLTLHTDPDRTLGLLETARLHEPTNEDIYRSIMTIHDHQHRPDAALNTYALLQAHLDNLDNTLTPEPATTALALRIRDTHTQQLRRSVLPRSA